MPQSRRRMIALAAIGLSALASIPVVAQYGPIDDLKILKPEDKQDAPSTPPPAGAIVLFSGTVDAEGSLSVRPGPKLVHRHIRTHGTKTNGPNAAVTRFDASRVRTRNKAMTRRATAASEKIRNALRRG